MRPAALLLTAALPTIAIVATPALPTLAAVKERERVLIVFAASADDTRLVAQDRLLASASGGLAERDLRVVRVIGATTAGLGDSAAALRGRLGIAASAFAVRLIGKDGHVAIARATPIATSALFGAIDAMPMRRDEMRGRR